MLQVLLTLLPLALCVYLIRFSRGRLQRALQASLAEQWFSTPQGKVSGAQLEVVKRSVQVARSPGNTPSELFWYCTGPGPSYFLAIAKVKQAGRGYQIDWIVRPLSEQRFRAAL